MKRLLMYYSRTDSTRQIAEDIAQQLDAEILEIRDDRRRLGKRGYMLCCIDALRRNPPKVYPPKTALPLEEYDQIILAGPVWAETWCSPVRSLLRDFGKLMKGQVSLVLVHGGGGTYEKAARRMDRYLPAPHAHFLSLSMGKDTAEGRAEKIAAFVAELQG